MTIMLELDKEESETIRNALKMYMNTLIESRNEDGTITTKRDEDGRDRWSEGFSVCYRIQCLWEDACPKSANVV